MRRRRFAGEGHDKGNIHQSNHGRVENRVSNGLIIVHEQCLKLRDELGRSLKSVAAALCQQLVNNGGDFGRQARTNLVDRYWLAFALGIKLVHHRFESFERSRSRQQVIKGTTEAIQVRAHVGAARIFYLLRGHEIRRAD